MKKYLKVSLLFLLLVNIITLCSCKKEKDVQKSFPEIVTNLKSYKLSGKLESMFPSGNKECEVVAYYKSPNLYRVELKNVGNNEPQLMIKNQDGIYVLLPSDFELSIDKYLSGFFNKLYGFPLKVSHDIS